jgi:DNA-binding transcriptional MerR regulator
MESSDEIGHLSIGEVLSQLQREFPDVTISKIRFLESQGLIDPERTPSGYRKFYEPDIERLTWILRQQRDHFLPLKVIKARLDQGGEIDFDSTIAVQPNLWSELDGEPESTPAGTVETPWKPATPKPAAPRSAAPKASSPKASPPKASASTKPAEAGRSADEPNSGRDAGAWLAELQESPRPPAAAPSSRPVDTAGVAMPRGVRFGLAEVVEVTGVDERTVESMIEFGLLTPYVIGGETTFDATSVAVVRAVARFLGRGIESRHLRMFKNAAEREAGFYEQLILPLLKQRNPKAREQAGETLEALTEAGDELSRALVRQALRAHLGD